MGEHAVNPKDCTHGDGVIAVTPFLVKPVILRRLGPVNDGSDVHLSPGHSNWLEELCMRLTLLSRILPRFARLMSGRTSGGMLSALTSRVGNFALINTLVIGSHSTERIAQTLHELYDIAGSC